MSRLMIQTVSAAAMAIVMGAGGAAQVAAPANPSRPASPTQSEGVAPPPGYVIGPDDLLTVVFWKDQDMTADVVVRPDGKITLPLLNDVQAAGLTPEELKDRIAKAAGQFVEAPNVMVRVREIKSRFVTIIGEVSKQGPVAIGGPMTVVQLLGLAGGLTEFANAKKILIVRSVNGQDKTFTFNYNDYKNGKPAGLKQNILLQPGDVVTVP
jgi:polysaccharide biosynthesis/export protein